MVPVYTHSYIDKSIALGRHASTGKDRSGYTGPLRSITSGCHIKYYVDIIVIDSDLIQF